ncbi:RNA polymerase sigma factor [Sphingomonas sp. ERG5]|uniref:RNA polymerase sigma factor n=1 Tax=Sphingomonas sp. ERG5 TaxID=1381597 RepID=UPI00054B777E|nr:RNA polymerase sigma factor [Sphingomonas sp. ERG5]
MTDAIRAVLRRSLRTSYRDLIQRLTRKLGSPDLAQEALHETWLRLERPGALSDVANPEAYLYRSALNAATNIRVSEGRRLNAMEIEVALDIPDEAPGPDVIAEGRADFTRLERALADLPERQRAVLCASLLETISYEALAARHGVTVRTIHSDIRHAVEHCADRLGVETIFTFDRRRLSRK